MGFLDKLKSAGKALTGGQADISIEYQSQPIERGKPFNVKVTVRSTGGEVKSEGVYVDILARETGSLKGNGQCGGCQQSVEAPVKIDKTTFDQQFTIGSAFVLAENESKVFDGQVTLPAHLQGTYMGSVNHAWKLRGRLEAFGNDPDTGYQTIVVK
jgi:hypothetical protein